VFCVVRSGTQRDATHLIIKAKTPKKEQQQDMEGLYSLGIPIDCEDQTIH